MKRYAIEAARGAVPLTGAVEDTAWAAANAVEIDDFPWYEGGKKQRTTARALYDDRNLYLQFLAEDEHSYAETTELNGPVYEDSCVEFFFAPAPERRPEDYVNVEINCCGTMLARWQTAEGVSRYVTPELAAEIRRETSVDGRTKAESPEDDSWWVAVELPFSTLTEFTGRSIDPDPGDRWRGNFYRCGGKTDPQFAAWNPIDAPSPDFHRPDCFGEFTFG